MKIVMQNTPANKHIVKQIIKRATAVAVVIGSALTLVNQTDAIFGDAELQTTRAVLAFLTPFLVVGISQVFGMRAARKELSQHTGNHHGFIPTLFSHGIPVRSAIVGLISGGATAAIAVTANMAAGQGINQPPVDLILPAVLLPIIFGAVSQVLSFRRTIRQSNQPLAAFHPV